MTNKQTIELIFEIEKHEYISANHRAHWALLAKKKRILTAKGFHKARALIKTGKMKTFMKFASEIHVYHPTKAKFDASNVAPTYKSLLDGMIMAKIAKDDNSNVHIKESYIGVTDKQSPKGKYILKCVLSGEVE
jgi:hypothetical protein